METLDDLCKRHGADKSSLYHDYAKSYARLFEAWRDLPIRLLEIGVQYGYSMKTWLDYFSKATIIGVDIDPKFGMVHSRYHEVIADQTNASHMQSVATKFGPFDVVIDDGCHLASAAKVSFDCLWPAVVSDGLYVIEDVCTYYHPMYQSAIYGGGWLHSFVDDVHQRGKNFFGVPGFTPNPTNLTQLEQEIRMLYMFKNLVVLAKR